MLPILRCLGKKIIYSQPSSLVLMFHHVTDSPAIPQSGCLLRTEDFYDKLDMFTNYASLKEVLATPHKQKIAITFDDGLADLYTIAYPYLKKKQIPFTTFISAGLLDKPGYITTDQLLALHQDPLVTIGSHGITHRILPELSSQEKKQEIQGSKQMLEELLQDTISYFAYSHGQYDRECLQYAKIYQFGFSVRHYPLNRITEQNRLLIPRLNVENATLAQNEALFYKYYIKKE